MNINNTREKICTIAGTTSRRQHNTHHLNALLHIAAKRLRTFAARLRSKRPFHHERTLSHETHH
ncbi:MAG: hypothetical protein IKH84_03885, partial [Ottowia sp.]|nr:hypothetical protein [Ottowia sp.]